MAPIWILFEKWKKHPISRAASIIKICRLFYLFIIINLFSLSPLSSLLNMLLCGSHPLSLSIAHIVDVSVQHSSMTIPTPSFHRAALFSLCLFFSCPLSLPSKLTLTSWWSLLWTCCLLLLFLKKESNILTVNYLWSPFENWDAKILNTY